ncbi:unnamed protein product [Durusdinium trenchii]|uniref:Uncharacterized protein n=1 Tax=Durusdinium trenchii TaxID=1381693 RepID=A0ABP0QJC6_9DINO
MLRQGVPVAIALFALRVGWQLRCYLELPASQFQHLLHDPGQTSKAYADHAGHELSLLSGKRRGMILNDFCKKTLAQLHPDSKIEEPRLGTCCNGARRSASQAEYDFSMDGRKVRCKSAQMSWGKHAKHWRVKFQHIKLPWPGFRDQAPFDELYLTIFSPDSLHIIKHDLQTRVTSSGKRTASSGHDIHVDGASGQECWQTARSQILEKLLVGGRCKLVARVELSDVEVRDWLLLEMDGVAPRQDNAYKRVPLNHMTPRLRGTRIEEIAFELDQCLHQNLSFSRHCPTANWVRGGVAVEVKHGQMRFNKGKTCWRCTFSGIKSASDSLRDLDKLNELWLAIYSPFGLHFLKHPGGKVRFCDTGAGQQAAGSDIHIYAPSHVLDVREACSEMLRKMKEWGCQPLATVHW